MATSARACSTFSPVPAPSAYFLQVPCGLGDRRLAWPCAGGDSGGLWPETRGEGSVTRPAEHGHSLGVYLHPSHARPPPSQRFSDQDCNLVPVSTPQAIACAAALCPMQPQNLPCPILGAGPSNLCLPWSRRASCQCYVVIQSIFPLTGPLALISRISCLFRAPNARELVSLDTLMGLISPLPSVCGQGGSPDEILRTACASIGGPPLTMKAILAAVLA